jgi:acyl dehydratase
MEQGMTFTVGLAIVPLQKQIAQERIQAFELSGGKTTPSFFTDAEVAKKTLGLSSPMASGRMSLSFAVECLRRLFGNEVYNRSGMVDLRNLRPVRAGDTITVSGKIVSITHEANGQCVKVDISIQNQNGETTAAGFGAAIVPTGYMSVPKPPEAS